MPQSVGRFFIVLVAVMPLAASTGQDGGDPVPAAVRYLGQTPPGITPVRFAPGIVSPNYRVRYGRAWDRAWEVAGTALAMWTLPRHERDEVVPGADHFYAHNLVQPAWAPEEPLAVIGDHAFVRLGL